VSLGGIYKNASVLTKSSWAPIFNINANTSTNDHINISHLQAARMKLTPSLALLVLGGLTA
jgi:hypothetical protein